MSCKRSPASAVAVAAIVCALLDFSSRVAAQPEAGQSLLPDIQKLGPQVGTHVPDFVLLDQPYCKTQLVELQGRVAQLKRQGLSVAGVSYDSVAVLADFSRRRGITFPLLSDSGSRTIKQYGIFNTTIPETNQQTYGIPFPGTFMLNAQEIHHVSVGQHVVDLVRNGDAEFFKFTRHQRARSDERHTRTKLR